VDRPATPDSSAHGKGRARRVPGSARRRPVIAVTADISYPAMRDMTRIFPTDSRTPPQSLLTLPGVLRLLAWTGVTTVMEHVSYLLKALAEP